jgi:hypothetical protein
MWNWNNILNQSTQFCQSKQWDFTVFSQVRCVWYKAISPHTTTPPPPPTHTHTHTKKKCTKPIYHLGIFSIHYSLTKLFQGKVRFPECVCACRERKRRGEREPVISQCQPIKHISSISAWAIHSRHSSTLLTASALHYRIEQNLKKFETLLDKS